MAIRDLASHHARYVTIAELAEYWGVSRQQIYKRIESGALDAIQLGSRRVRVPATAALDYERRARVASGTPRGQDAAAKGVSPSLEQPSIADLSRLAERQIRHHRAVIRSVRAADDRAHRNQMRADEDPIDPDERPI